MHPHLHFMYCRDHYNQRELCDDYREKRVHIVSPACLGRANFCIGLTLEYPDYPKGALSEGREIGEQANRTQSVQTMLPKLPQTALPMNPESTESVDAPPPNAALLRERCLKVFELHFNWVYERLQQGEDFREWPRLFFNLDQEGQFPVRQTIAILKELSNDPEPIYSLYEKIFNRHEEMDIRMRIPPPFIEVRYTSCP